MNNGNEKLDYFTQINKIPLNEANLNRVVNGHDQNGYTIISAFRQDLWKLEDGSIVDKEPTQGNYIKLKLGSQLHIDANNIRTNNLRNMIKKEFSYIPVFGRFKTSFIVFPFNLKTKSDVPFDYFVSRISQFGRQFNQDSVLIKYSDIKWDDIFKKEGLINAFPNSINEHRIRTLDNELVRFEDY